jgi:hypothetical protein
LSEGGSGVGVKAEEFRRVKPKECRQEMWFRNGTKRTLERKKRGFPAVTELSDSYTAKSIICRQH